jgi:hypothetical protein
MVLSGCLGAAHGFHLLTWSAAAKPQLSGPPAAAAAEQVTRRKLTGDELNSDTSTRCARLMKKSGPVRLVIGAGGQELRSTPPRALPVGASAVFRNPKSKIKNPVRRGRH